MLRQAAAHRGTSFVEIYQNCPIFNDDAFLAIKDPSTSADAIIPLKHGEPIRFGTDGHLGVVRDPRTGQFTVVEVDEVGVDALAVHDAHIADPSFAFGLSRITDSGVLHRAPIGIFRDVEAPAYDDLAREQVAAGPGGKGSDDDALAGDDRRPGHVDRRLSYDAGTTAAPSTASRRTASGDCSRSTGRCSSRRDPWRSWRAGSSGPWSPR